MRFPLKHPTGRRQRRRRRRWRQAFSLPHSPNTQWAASSSSDGDIPIDFFLIIISAIIIILIFYVSFRYDSIKTHHQHQPVGMLQRHAKEHLQQDDGRRRLKNEKLCILIHETNSGRNRNYIFLSESIKIKYTKIALCINILT